MSRSSVENIWALPRLPGRVPVYSHYGPSILPVVATIRGVHWEIS